MAVNNINLNICDILDIRENGFQKCLIPNEYFDGYVQVGTLAKCETDKGEIFFCYLFSLKNNFSAQHCFLDDSVQIGSKFRKRTGGKLLKIVACKEEIMQHKILNVEIEINKHFFEISLSANDLKDIIKVWLQKFTLYGDCTVNGDEFLKSLGIENILVFSLSNVPYQVNMQTDIIVKNVFYNEFKLKKSVLKGLDYVSAELNNLMNSFNMQKKVNWKRKPSLNALIIGSSGCGKTSVCQNWFLENECNVFNIRPSEIMRQYPGETEEILRKIYSNAKIFVKSFTTRSPTVIFIEDIDLLCPSVFELDSYNIVRISSQVYSILDDLFVNQINIMLIATTSQIDRVNMQLRRPERFEKEIQIHIPTAKDREDILKQILSTTSLRSEISEELILNVVEKTPGFVGSDLNLLIQKVCQNIFLMKKTSKINQQELSVIFQNVLRTSTAASIQSTDIKIYKCEETFENIGGGNDLKNSLKVSILTPLKKPEIFKKFGLKMSKGILLYGPPGCAKTTVAKCLANEANMTFIPISGAEVYSPYVGKAEKYISKIFDTARRNSPCLIFFDELETLVGKRTSSSKSDVQTRILSTLLQEMDGIGLKIDEGIKIDKNENYILVVGATNRPDMIDDALLRPGRFDKLIHVPAPNTESRLEILKLLEKKMPFERNINLIKLAEKTEYFSGADLCNLCNEAALYAFTNNNDVDVISENDFDIVLKDLKPSLSKKQIDWYFNFENKFIY
ncbi:ribosome biogenesis protein SPATA5L1 [Condylostylus longicornis]|uniref:ribosome biogenesis protein SPATA5L1 n=1 Tax=Condylostylus longicornis TaxID=2530218 RepID=UPI00244DCAA2|nr:ribosome biogenesis protein SPATA5L1 [Condylostylus longicornis]